MSWRIRTAIAFSALVMFYLGAQPTLRWMVSKAISQNTFGSATIDGWTIWSASQNTLSLSHLRIEDDNGNAIRIESVSAKINPGELLRRNLVIDSATLDGVVIQPGPNATSRFKDDSKIPNPQVPTLFQDSVWAGQIDRSMDDRMQKVAHERLAVRAALESRCERLQQRAESSSMLGQNSLRAREFAEEAQKDLIALRQAVAEERVRLRELDRELQRDTLDMLALWPDQLAAAIQSTFPDPQSAVHEAASRQVSAFFNEHQPILDIALWSSLSHTNRSIPFRGVDISLPGITDSYTLIHAASLYGRIEYADRVPILFKCNFSDWSVSKVASKLQPRSEWRFQMPSSDGSRAINIEVENLQQDQNGSRKFAIAIHDEAGQASAVTSHLVWDRHNDEDLIELILPVTLRVGDTQSTNSDAIWGSNPVWIECLDSVFKEQGPVQVQATLRAAQGRILSTSCPPDSMNCHLNPKSQAQLQSISQTAQSRYFERSKEMAFERVKQTLGDSTRARQATWIQISSEQKDLLARIENETGRIKMTMNAPETAAERMAKRP